MKLDINLRVALRAAHKIQSLRHSYEAERQRQADAVHAFLARGTGTGAKLVHRLVKALAANYAQSASLHGELAKLGLGVHWASGELALVVADEKLFADAGGRVAPVPKPWNVDVVMCELAAAAPSRRQVILSKYGIDWR